MYNMSAINQYQRVEVDSRIAAANPHTLISMLLDGAMKKIAIACGATQRGDIAQKGSSISAALRIIDSLRASLDHERGGEVAANLEALYYYMETRLAEANRKSDTGLMTEVSQLLGQIRQGWEDIPHHARG